MIGGHDRKNTATKKKMYPGGRCTAGKSEPTSKVSFPVSTKALAGKK